MTTETIHISFYFDFLCPYTYNTTQWIDNIKQEIGDRLLVDWKYFSLEQTNAPPESGRKLWEQPEDYEPMIPGRGPTSRALLAFWGAEAARQQGAAPFDRFRQALAHARHRERITFDRPSIEAVAASAELDMERFRQDFNNRDLLDAVRRDHEEAVEKYHVFGVPTICFDEQNAIYIKLTQVPPPEDAAELFYDLRRNYITRHWLAEVKRPNPKQ